MTPSKSRWLAAAQLGFVSSTFSTLLSQVTASQLGRDALVDWMTVAAIPARDGIMSSDPTGVAIAIGIAFHQWADFSWALVFFGLLGRWTAGLPPVVLAALAIPWALLTSATEWFVLVPLFPFWQPIFTLQQPYWIGFLVHLSSAMMYPVFAWLRWPIGQAPSTRAVRFARRWAFGAACVLVVSSALGAAHSISVSIPLISQSRDEDRRYIRHMVAHHEQGIELARLGASRAQDPHLRALAALMVASQTGENRIFASWWDGWFADPMPICSGEELSAMPGYLTTDEMAEARGATVAAFDVVFVRLMSQHHAGAVRMADAEWRSAGDPRLRLMAHAIRHEQQGEFALMNGVDGIEAVRQATATCSRTTFRPSKIRRPRCEGTKRLLASLIGDEASIPERFRRDPGCFDRPTERRRSWTEPPRWRRPSQRKASGTSATPCRATRASGRARRSATTTRTASASPTPPSSGGLSR